MNANRDRSEIVMMSNCIISACRSLNNFFIIEIRIRQAETRGVIVTNQRDSCYPGSPECCKIAGQLLPQEVLLDGTGSSMKPDGVTPNWDLKHFLKYSAS